MMVGIYIGGLVKLKGKKALLKDAADPTKILAQFDDMPSKYAFGWHGFDRTDFIIERLGDEEEAIVP